MSYTPTQKILDNYADVLVNFAINGCNGIKKGEVVSLEVPECAKPILLSLQKAVLKSGAHYITHYLPEGTSRQFFELAQEHQINFFPEKYLRSKVDQLDHSISILSTTNHKELEGISPEKIMNRSKSFKPYKDWREEKENNGKYTWTLALYGTEEMAKEAGLSLKEYWNQIIKACYLDLSDPILQWRKSIKEVERVKDKLNDLPIQDIRIKSQGTDLTIGIDKYRKWLGGSGRNIPSFEVFISPDWRKTEGFIEFDMPLYRYGNRIEGIKLEFKEGCVVKSNAKTNYNVLKEMIMAENADKVGEFSLTDIRLSKIDKFMAETLFDENFGGKFGNIHIALGSAYKDSFPTDPSKISKEKWKELGYNESVVHTDMISTLNREVTAILEDNTHLIIYRDGKFLI